MRKSSKPPASEFGRILRARRESLGLSQAQAAEELGVAYQTYIEWETRGRAPSLTDESMPKLQRVLSWGSSMPEGILRDLEELKAMIASHCEDLEGKVDGMISKLKPADP